MSWYLLAYVILGWLILLSMIPVILRRQFAPGASLAWLLIIVLHPYIGAVLYLLVGESRLGPRRVEQRRQVVERLRDPARHGDRLPHQLSAEAHPSYESMVQQAEKICDLPVLSGNRVEFIPDAVQFLDRLIAEINSAQKTIHLNYYIFATDAQGHRAVDALIAAAGRGVQCRVLADGLASRKFLRRFGLSRKLRTAGVKVAAALPVAPIRRRLARLDLRNHRKMSIFDGKVAYSGSHNLTDPSYGGKRGNPWVDLTGRFEGPIVGELALVFAEDWFFETGEEVELPLRQALKPAGEISAQAVPTGPTAPSQTYRRLLLAAIQASRKQLILTTPYFVPDEPTVLSLCMAADRGVEVKLIMPRLCDQYFVTFAGQAFFQTLLNSGIAIYQYRPGMLHSKTATVDDAFCLFGSANLDVRSFNLNFELTVLLYGSESADQLRKIQEDYISRSDRLDPAVWAKRPLWAQYGDRAVALLSPLL